MGSTNYFDTFIQVAADCGAPLGRVPPAGTVAGRQYALIAHQPYRLTSDDVLFTVWADRQEIPEGERAEAREAFFAKSQACLRASPLGKKFGWGVHADAQGRVASSLASGADEIRRLLARADLLSRSAQMTR